MKDWLLQQGLQLVLPLIIGLLATRGTQLLKRASEWLDTASPMIKKAVPLVLSAALAVAVKFAGDALPAACILNDDPMACVDSLTEVSAMKVFLSYIFARLLFAQKKADELKEATTSTQG